MTLERLLAGVKTLKSQETTHTIETAVSEMIKNKQLIRTEIDEYHSMVHLSEMESTYLKTFDGTLYDSNLIAEWRIQHG